MAPIPPEAQAHLLLPDGTRVPAKDQLTMGRLSACDIVLTDTKASRRHARLHVEAGVFEVEDLGSHNGTLLNGKPVQRRVLRDGDEIQIGTTILVFREAAANAAAPAAVAAPTAPARPSVLDPSGPIAPPAVPGRGAATTDAGLGDLGDLGGVDLTAELGGFDEATPDTGTPAGASAAAEPTAFDPLAPPPAVDRATGRSAAPSERPAPSRPPRPEASRRPDAGRGPGGVGRGDDSGGAPAEDVEVLEFVDEVVQVRRREVKPTGTVAGGGATTTTRGAAGARGGPEPRAPRVEHGVLQFSRQASSSTVATDDLRQMPAAMRALLILVAIAIAVGLGWLAMVLAR